ncbi:putative ef hand domain-containing protein [Erysiphe necator]|uniref:Putative ef hand domain-containing protein n=1 Tax=Uncinula necator TaxID=52586 RepID=A0A0B1P7T3_UNCNE|nr:putative ef hand domain-containing protein [Erysiphe necator]
MAEDPKSSATPLLNLTLEEKRLFGHLFRQADSEGIGVVTGEAAVKFFEKTRIEPRILGEIWQIADKENRGLLTPAGFGIVLRLIGHYQAGRDPIPELALRPGPLPRFENLDVSSLSPTTKQPLAPITRTLEPQASGSTSIRVPPLTPDKATQYADLFEKSGSYGGILSGEHAKQVFERAGLPNEVLGRIWSLADTEQKGALEANEFIIAMHLIASLKKGQMRLLPNTLPPGLYEAASRRTTGRSISGAAAISSIPGQLSGSSSTRSTYIKSPQLPLQSTGSNSVWLVTSSDQVKFDSIFNSLDKANRGFITGDEVVPFFNESKLPEDTLAQIWDLADINSAGRLSREEFAVAMYLIRLQRAKRDGRKSLPSKLPANLVPPSMRNQTRPTAVGADPSFHTNTPVLPGSAAEDLFGLDALSTSAFNEQSAQNIEATPLSVTSRGMNKANDDSLHSLSTPSVVIKPFKPASTFGQTLNQQVTGGSSHNMSLVPQNLRPQKSLEDLLGDTDAEISNKLTDETAKLANLSSQSSSLSKQAQDLQVKRIFLQNESAQSVSKKAELEDRLAQARNLYEQEMKEVQNFQEQLLSTRNETYKLRIEAERLESTLQNLRSEHSEIKEVLLIDQKENSNLKERISLLNSEIAQLRTLLENAKIDAKKQKGLVSISQKQLLTNEEERDKLKSQIEELNSDINTESAGPLSSIVETPSLGTNSASSKNVTTNPFFRRIESFSENPFSKIDSSAGSQQSEMPLKSIYEPSKVSSIKSDTQISNSELEEAKPSSLDLPKTTAFIPNNSIGDSSFKPLSLIPQNPLASSELPERVETSFSILESQPLSSESLFLEGSNQPAQTSKNTYDSEENLAGLSTTIVNFSKIQELPIIQPLSTTDDNKVKKNSASDQIAFESLETTRTVKDDFDSAFASFGSNVKPQNYINIGRSYGSGTTNSVGLANEFPPIAEMEDDDSDSSIEGNGFDDDFATACSTLEKSTSSTSKTPIQSSGTEDLSLKSTETQGTTKLAPKSSGNDNILISDSAPPLPGSLLSSSEFKSVNQLTASSKARLQTTENVLSTNQVELKASADSLSSSANIPQEDEFSEFDDLEDAEEGDSNDEFAKISGTDHSLMNDIDSMFDKSLMTKDAGSLSKFPTDDECGQLSKPYVQATSIPNDKNDWDSIFSGLDATEPHLTESYTGRTNTGNKSISINENSKVETEASENNLNDDPFLKKLTGMGYQRTEALVALESFDYNLEKAANFLASQT